MEGMLVRREEPERLEHGGEAREGRGGEAMRGLQEGLCDGVLPRQPKSVGDAVDEFREIGVF